jgi:hypothetical protein
MRYVLTIRWTAGHEGIEGNKATDEEAKRAAEGTSLDKCSLPQYLRKHLLINPAAAKSVHYKKLKGKWKTKWRSSERGQKAVRINMSTPSKKFLGSISQNELSHEAVSRIAQFRLTHVPVNQYLKRIGKVNSTRCLACGADKETIEHFLLRCPSYAHERWALVQQAKKQRKQMSMETLLSTPKMAVHLANYIDTTNRFKYAEKA